MLTYRLRLLHGGHLCRQAKREILEVQPLKSGIPLLAGGNQCRRRQRAGADKISGLETRDPGEFAEAKGRASKRVLAGSLFDRLSVARQHELEAGKLLDKCR